MCSTVQTSAGARAVYLTRLTSAELAAYQLSKSHTAAAWPEAQVSSSLWQGAAAPVTMYRSCPQPPTFPRMASRRCATTAKPGACRQHGLPALLNRHQYSHKFTYACMQPVFRAAKSASQQSACPAEPCMSLGHLLGVFAALGMGMSGDSPPV